MRLLFVVILLLCVSLSAHADKLKIGIFDFPPFYSMSSDHVPQGILVNLATSKLNALGLDYEFIQYKVPQLIEAVKTGEVDLVMLIKHPALIDIAFYSEKPISTIELISYRRKNSPKINEFEDYEGKRVLTLAGYGYNGLLKKARKLYPPVKFIEVSDINSGLDLLIANRGDYFLSYKKPSIEVARRKGFEFDEDFLMADEISQFDVFWVVSHTANNAAELIDRLN